MHDDTIFYGQSEIEPTSRASFSVESASTKDGTITTTSSKGSDIGRREEMGPTLAGFDVLRFKNSFLEVSRGATAICVWKFFLSLQMVEELRLLRVRRILVPLKKNFGPEILILCREITGFPPYTGGLYFTVLCFMQTLRCENDEHVEQLLKEKHELANKLVCPILPPRGLWTQLFNACGLRMRWYLTVQQ